MLSGADDRAWERHAHPASVWSRILLGLPLLILAGWSRVWIGPWSIAALAGALLFLCANPRITPRPASNDSWGARAVLGERLWIRSATSDLPKHHRLLPWILVGGSAAGHLLLLLGVVALDARFTALGYAVGLLCKLWYLDRMVWLEADIRSDDGRTVR
jgi:hypothetical protein